MIKRSTLTTEYLAWPLEDNGIEVVDGGTAVDFAFMAASALGVSEAPGDGDWVEGTIAESGDGGYDLAILVGPGDDALALEAGLYRVWARITDTEERPVRAVDWLEITP